jgi:hypothetical protein
MSNPTQFDTVVRNAVLQAIEDAIGTSPKLRYCTGSIPASCSAAQTGTQIVEMTLPSDWQAAPSGGASAKSGTWSGTSSTGGVAGYWRLLSSAGTCRAQNTISQAFKLTTSASTAAGSNVLTFTSASGVVAGQNVYGTGVATGTTVLSATGTTVTLSLPSTAGVTSSTDIYFGDTSGGMWMPNTTIGTGVVVTCDTFNLIAMGA